MGAGIAEKGSPEDGGRGAVGFTPTPGPVIVPIFADGACEGPR